MDERLHPGRARGLGHMPGAFVLHGVEGLPAARAKNADEIDHRIGAVRRSEQQVRVTHIGLDRDDLADAAERLEEACKLRPAHGDAHACAGLGQRPHHMAANKARAAIDGDEGRAA